MVAEAKVNLNSGGKVTAQATQRFTRVAEIAVAAITSAITAAGVVYGAGWNSGQKTEKQAAEIRQVDARVTVLEKSMLDFREAMDKSEERSRAFEKNQNDAHLRIEGLLGEIRGDLRAMRKP